MAKMHGAPKTELFTRSKEQSGILDHPLFNEVYEATGQVDMQDIATTG